MSRPSYPPSDIAYINDAFFLAGKFCGMGLLGLFGFAALASWSDALPLDNEFEESDLGYDLREEALPSFYSAPRVFGRSPSTTTPYLGTLAGMCQRCGGGEIAILPSSFANSSKRAWSCGMGAYQGFGWQPRWSQRARLQGMADGELYSLMEDLVQESKRRQSALRDFACQSKAWEKP